MKKTLLFLLTICSVFMSTVSPSYSATSATQNVSATLTRPVVPPPPGGGGGGAVAVAVGSGAAAAGLGGAAFAPLLLAGLSPNAIIAAAAPIGCIACKECFLQKAIMDHFSMPDIANAAAAMNSNCNKIYFAQNDSRLLNGTFDMQGIVLPNYLLNAQEIRVNITLASDPYSEVKGEPELKLALYKDIAQSDLRKKFETQQFTRYYLMKKYDVPLLQNLKAYNNGLQKLSGTIDISHLKNKDMPLQVAMTYTEGGFQKNQAVENPKVKTYAYLLEFEKVR